MAAQTAMSGRVRLAFAAAVIVAVAIGFLSWTRLPHAGLPTLSFDGFRYAAGAYSIRDHRVYLDLDGLPQHVWPPGTSCVYAVVSRVTGRAPEDLPGAIGICAYLITVLAFAIALARTVRRWWIASIAFVAVACNSFIVSMTNKLWSDPLALALFVITLAVLVTPRASLRSISFAAVAVAIGVAFRYAMISALVLPLFAAWRMRVRWLVPAAASGAAIVLFMVSNRLSGFRSVPFPDDLRAFGTLAAQIVPSQLGVLGLLVLAAALAISARALPVAGVWIGAYIAFLFVAQAIARPSFALDLRILIPLYPAVVLAIAAGADNARHEWLKFSLAAMLMIAGARGLHGLVPHPAPSPACVTREQIVAQLKSTGIPPGSPLASNAQGLVWYALRRPVSGTARPGDTVVAVDPSRACDGIVETTLAEVPATRRIVLP